MAEQTRYGGFWIRVLAYLVDMVIIFTALVVLGFGAMYLGTVANALLLPVFALGPLLYVVLLQASERQATLGKSLLGLKVTTADGERLSFLRSLGRELAKIISGIPMMLGFAMAGFTQRKQALHDYVASSLVVRDNPGRLVVGLLVGVFGWAAPAALAVTLGVGVLASAMGISTGEVLQQAMKQEKPAAVARTAPPPKPAPSAPSAVTEAPPPPPPPVAAPVAAPATPPAEKPAPAAPVPEPRTATIAKVVENPAPAQPQPVETARAEAPVQVPIPAEPVRPGPKFNDLMTAVLYSDTEAVGHLLRLGKWPDKPDSHGTTPLAAAAMLGDVKTAEVLLKAGANPAPAIDVARERGDGAMTSLLERYAK